MPTAAAIAGGVAAIGGSVIGSRSADKALDAQSDAADKSAAQLAAAQAQARGDLFKLFPAAQQNAQQGYQGALDVFNQTLPQQSDIYQQGNVAAQNQLINAMPQYQNAILGGAVDYSQFQPTVLEQPDYGFANQQLSYTDPFAPPPPVSSPNLIPGVGDYSPPPWNQFVGPINATTDQYGPYGQQPSTQAPGLGGQWPTFNNFKNMNLRGQF